MSGKDVAGAGTSGSFDAAEHGASTAPVLSGAEGGLSEGPHGSQQGPHAGTLHRK